MKAFSEKRDRFDLALLDHGMADITGLELAQRFRRIRPGFPVVVYTGYLDTPSAEQLEAANIGGRVVIKPADPEGTGRRAAGSPAWVGKEQNQAQRQAGDRWQG